MSIVNTGKLGKTYDNSSRTAGGFRTSDVVDLGSAQSMFCWFRFVSLSNNSELGCGIISQHRYPKNTGLGITVKYVSSTTGYLSANTGTGTSRTYNTYCGSTLLQANTWYHVGITYDGTNVLKLYVNGVCDGTHNVGQMSTPADYLMLYCWSLSSSSGATVHNNYVLNGAINDARVYDECLSPKEVEILARGLVLHYPLSLPMPNLLPHTTPSYGLGYMNSYSSGTVTVDSTETFCGNSTIRIQPTSSTTSSGGINNYNSDSVKLTSGVKYCYSCWIKSTVDDTFTTGSLGHFQTVTSSAVHNRTVLFEGMTIPANTWTQVYIVFTPTADCSVRSFFIYFANTSQKIWVSKVKLEQGDHPTSYCPGSGDTEYSAMGFNDTTEYDVSGNKYNGTKIGTLPFNSDSSRYITSTYISDGRSNYISAPITIGQGTNLTINMWVKSLQGWTGYNNYHIPFSIGAGKYEFSIPNSGKFRQGFYVGNTRYCDDYGSVNLLDKNWHMISATFDGTQIKRYVDGVLVNTTSVSGSLQTGDLTMYLGTYNSGGYATSDMLHSDFRIYATALTPTQIQEIYNTSISISNNGTLMGYELVEQ